MLLGSQYSHLRSHFSLPMGSRNDFYFIFWNDHARFCVGEHGVSTRALFGQKRFYYATTTQKSGFCQKKDHFFRCHASSF